MDAADPPLRLTIDGEALAAQLAAAGAGERAARAAARRSRPTAMAWARARRSIGWRAAGCRDFFVATWAEAAALAPWPEGLRLSVLHGVRDEDMRRR